MSDYPVPFRGESDGRWHEDMNEDYRNARDDDERRQILLSFGYDKAHEAEVYRLFGPPSNSPEGQKSELPEQEEKEKQHPVCQHLRKRWKQLVGAAAGVGALVGFLANLPAALQTFSRLLDLLLRFFHL